MSNEQPSEPVYSTAEFRIRDVAECQAWRNANRFTAKKYDPNTHYLIAGKSRVFSEACGETVLMLVEVTGSPVQTATQGYVHVPERMIEPIPVKPEVAPDSYEYPLDVALGEILRINTEADIADFLNVSSNDWSAQADPHIWQLSMEAVRRFVEAPIAAPDPIMGTPEQRVRLLEAYVGKLEQLTTTFQEALEVKQRELELETENDRLWLTLHILYENGDFHCYNDTVIAFYEYSIADSKDSRDQYELVRWAMLQLDEFPILYRSDTPVVKEAESIRQERETLGRLVRQEWVAYCKEQSDTKASHLTTWDELSEYDKEVDRRIGEVVAKYVRAKRDE